MPTRMRNTALVYIFLVSLLLSPDDQSLTEQQVTTLEYEATADPQPVQFQDS